VDNGLHLNDAAASDLGRLRALYQFSLGDRVRVAGRPAIELQIRPRDQLRYGYRIALDEQTHLPLHSVMLDSAGGLRSQTLFVDLKTGSHVTPIERDLSALQLAEPPPAPRSTAGPRPDGRWSAKDLPPGFALVSRLRMPPDVQHLVFTDGITSVSVYIEPRKDQAFEGFSRIGAIDIYGVPRGDAQLTVVGEVPRETLRLIADAMYRQ
jgi:sigma-E factor negative regulatory protein RseB